MKPTTNQTKFLPYLIKFRKNLLQRDFLAEIFTHTERVELETITHGGKEISGIYSLRRPYTGKLVKSPGKQKLLSVVSFSIIPGQSRGREEFYSCLTEDTDILDIPDETLTNALIEMTIRAGDIENYTKTEPLKTTVGRYIANYVLFGSIFGKDIPYLNAMFTPKKVLPWLPIDKPSLYYKHVDHRQYLTGCPEFYANNLTPKSLLTDPKIKEMKKKDLQENALAVLKGDAAKCSAMETRWQKADNEFLKGDESNVFLTGKLRANCRKKMFVTNGLRERFGVPGQYDFTSNSLEEGWTAGDFASLCNDARKGSFDRARETAKGGEESKFIIRVFQNTRVTEDDCKTQHYYRIWLEPHNADEYIGRNISHQGKIITLTKDNIRPFIGTVINLRSPLYCTAGKEGYCFVCMGESFSKTRQRTVAAPMTEIGSQMLKNSLKSMHNSTTKLNTLRNLNEYIVKTA